MTSRSDNEGSRTPPTRPAKKSRRRSPEPDAKVPWWRRGWALVTAGILTLGALASAITAIAGLWPGEDALDQAQVTSIEITEGVLLSEYAQQPGSGPQSLGGRTAAGQPSLVLVADLDESDTATPTPTPILTPTPTPTPAPPPTPPQTLDPGPLPPPNRRFYKDMLEEVHDLAPQYALPVNPKLGVPVTKLNEDIVDQDDRRVTPADAARRLVGILGRTKMQRHRGKLDPLGVVVAANLRVEGFRNHELAVSWRLVGRAGSRTPYSRWLDEVPAARITASTYRDGGAVQFWVPMPRKPGKYAVQVIIRDKSAQLFVKSSRSFG
jgi:hypothetical protein